MTLLSRSPSHLACAVVFLVGLCCGSGPLAAQDYQAIVSSPDRSDADRQTDIRREPAKMLAFTGVKTGMKVLDMEANAEASDVEPAARPQVNGDDDVVAWLRAAAIAKMATSLRSTCCLRCW